MSNTDPRSLVPDPRQPPWWMSQVIYQIYPRSFQDSSGDGVGDLKGVISRLDYLQDLGIGGIWLSPIYPSPLHDFGYDVSDYTAISPEFGTMDDFTALLEQAHQRGIKTIMDLVLNHTSDEHPWFEESTALKDGPKRDWYIWRDGPKGQLPNNWKSVFGGSSWEWHPGTEQYYLHSFLKEQPDVNWRNPELCQAMWDVIRFWLDLGVDGFRLDVVNCFVKDDHFRDNPRRYRGARPYDRQKHLFDRDRPETIYVMGEIRSLVDQFLDRMTVGEVMVDGPGNPQLAADYCDDGHGLHMAFNFAFASCPWRAEAFAGVVDEWETMLGVKTWPNYVLNNHDRSRSISRYASGLNRGSDAIPRAKVAAAMLLTLRGTPFLYYGEEIGMTDTRISRGKLQDPVGKRYWPLHPGRDPVRTPMQWNSNANAGFSIAEPWLPVNKNYQQTNASAQTQDPSSLLNWYKALIRLRNSEPVLQSGSYRKIAAGYGIFCYERALGTDRIVVALNFSRRNKTLSLPAPDSWHPLLREDLSTTAPISGPVTLPPYGVLIAKT
jgi:alpha-glucosidase